VEAAGQRSPPAVHRKEVGLVVVDHSRPAVAHIVPGSEEADHIAPDPEEADHIAPDPEEAAHIAPGPEEADHIVPDPEAAVHTRSAADHRFAEVDHHNCLAEVRRRNAQGRSELVVVALASRL
jgi:hypothetical protein